MAAGEDCFISTLNFGMLRLYAAGGVAGMSNFGMAGTSMSARPPWERKCGHGGNVKFWH